MWKEEAAPASSTSFLLIATGMKMTGKWCQKFSFQVIVLNWPHPVNPINLSPLCLLCLSQVVWAGGSWDHRRWGKPGVCERSHTGLQPWADPLHLPSTQESPSGSRLLLRQLLLRQIIRPTPVTAYINYIGLSQNSSFILPAIHFNYELIITSSDNR